MFPTYRDNKKMSKFKPFNLNFSSEIHSLVKKKALMFYLFLFACMLQACNVTSHKYYPYFINFFFFFSLNFNDPFQH